MNLPTSFTTTIRNTFGEDGKRWLAELPDLLAERLDFDRQRIRAWAIAHSVLSAWWDLEENGAGGEYSIACAEIFNQVKV